MVRYKQMYKECYILGNLSEISFIVQFLEKVQLLYSAKAKEANVYVVGSCGFDSIPVDMGVHFTRKNFKGLWQNILSFPSLPVNTFASL